jgi:hypothetical protein
MAFQVLLHLDQPNQYCDEEELDEQNRPDSPTQVGKASEFAGIELCKQEQDQKQ